MRLLTELLLFIGVTTPPSLVIARFAGAPLPSMLTTDVVLGFSTAALLAAFILATYMHAPARSRARRVATRRRRPAPLLMPAAEAFALTTASGAFTRSIPLPRKARSRPTPSSPANPDQIG